MPHPDAAFFLARTNVFFLQCCVHGQRMQNCKIRFVVNAKNFVVNATNEKSVLWCLVSGTVQVSKRSCYLKKSSSSILGHLQTETFFIVDRPQTLLRLSRHNGVPVNSPLKPLNPIVLWCFEQFQGVLKLSWPPYDAKRSYSLLNSYSTDRCLISSLHAKKSFRNLFKSTRNQSEYGKYNSILGWFNKISKLFLCV